ncbi:UNVERIFIED_CONTAM: hypothetical protein Slati_3875400 [Sesamum latifolium]|uniref:Uncharacterized protein n=1 Tax=Sesamum latifolium TaxID=2727402 RepID=A0AAW2TMH0_9LAMI
MTSSPLHGKDVLGRSSNDGEKGNSHQTTVVTALSPTCSSCLHSQVVHRRFLGNLPYLRITFHLPLYSCFRVFAKITPAVLSLFTSDESVHFVGESNLGPDPSETTSRMAGSPSAGPSSGRRRSIRRMAAAFRRLIDEEEEEEGSEGRRLPLVKRGRMHRDSVCSSSFLIRFGSFLPSNFAYYPDEGRILHP